MPDIEVLMEAWPPEIEEIVGNVNSLTPELDMPLEDYARMVSHGWSETPLHCAQRLTPRRIPLLTLERRGLAFARMPPACTLHAAK